MVGDDDLALETFQEFAVLDVQAHASRNLDVLDEDHEEKADEPPGYHVEAFFRKSGQQMEQREQRRCEEYAPDAEYGKGRKLGKQTPQVFDPANHASLC